MTEEKVEYKVMVIWHDSSGLEAPWKTTDNIKNVGMLLATAMIEYPLDRFWVRIVTTKDITPEQIDAAFDILMSPN